MPPKNLLAQCMYKKFDIQTALGHKLYTQVYKLDYPGNILIGKALKPR